MFMIRVAMDLWHRQPRHTFFYHNFFVCVFVPLCAVFDHYPLLVPMWLKSFLKFLSHITNL
jgi:hypothetical protein